MDGYPWTIEELAARVGDALAGGGYSGAPNGRVRDVPDVRAIRWYATLGLVDRAGLMRGRTGFYGRRHLLQLVAVKRRQAEGHRIAEIQAELSGAPDAALEAIADLPAGEAGAPSPSSPKAAAPPRYRADEAAPPRRTFWVDAPAPHRDAGPARGVGSVLSGVHLEKGAVLLIPAVPDHDDLAAILAAARPLLDLLAARGLLHEHPAHEHPAHEHLLHESLPSEENPDERGSATR